MKRSLQIIIILLAAGQFSSCSSSEEKPEEAKTHQEVKEEAKETPDAHLPNDGFLTAMNELKGIEKHFVQGDLKRYRSLLKYHGNEDYKKVDDFLPALDVEIVFLEIKELDARNGFIKFETPTVDCVDEMAYWQKANGTHLIGKTQVCCTMFCEGEIAFQSYDPDSGIYSNLESSDVIVDLDLITADLLEQQKNGGIDHQFVLPQNGLNLQHCIGDACVELNWSNGIFKLKD